MRCARQAPDCSCDRCGELTLTRGAPSPSCGTRGPRQHCTGEPCWERTWMRTRMRNTLRHSGVGVRETNHRRAMEGKLAKAWVSACLSARTMPFAERTGSAMRQCSWDGCPVRWVEGPVWRPKMVTQRECGPGVMPRGTRIFPWQARVPTGGHREPASSANGANTSTLLLFPSLCLALTQTRCPHPPTA